MLLPALAAASPVPWAWNNWSCWADAGVIVAIEADPLGTPFCSSFLRLSATTTTVTARQTVWSTATITGATNAITTLAPASTRTITNTVTATSTASVSKRGNSGTPVCTRPNAFKGWADYPVSVACSCLNIPTGTSTSTVAQTTTSVVTKTIAARTTIVATPAPVTVTLTSTTYVAAPTPSTCANQGLQYAYYPNQSGNNVDDVYSNFDPVIYKTIVPYFNSTTTMVGGITNSCTNGNITIYDSPRLSCNEFVLDHRGYLFAEEAGNYTINVGRPDDAVLVWVGADAYSGWTRPNANLYEYYNETAGSYSAVLQKGDYYPFRVMFVNAELEEAFSFDVTAPDGSIILGSNTAASPYFVQQSCDGTTAPAFPAWGHES